MNVKLLTITPNADKLIEECGRTSYLSYNKKTKNSSEKFVKMIIKNGHFSVLEHAFATFKISGVSRAFTHQIVRHRLASFTQQSQRYVNAKNFEYIIPDSIKENKDLMSYYIYIMAKVRNFYNELLERGIKKEDARFILPNAITNEIVISANFREWRHIIKIRGSQDAQWEIRNVIIEILKIFKKECPVCFFDFKIDENVVKQEIGNKND